MKNTFLKFYRKQNKLTQEKMAQRLNITRGHYNRIENGQQEPTIKMLKKISRIINISYIELLKEEEKKGA